MKYKINLHAHSKYSDGHNTVEEIAKVCKSLGFTACVITDHIYSEYTNYSLDTDSFHQQREEAQRVSKDLNYPVIIGAEISLHRYEEIVVIGTDALVEVFKIRDAKLSTPDYNFMMNPLLTIGEVKKIRQKHDCAVFLAHPCLANYDSKPSFIKAGGAEVLDGFELVNSGQKFFRKRDIPKEFNGMAQLCNSDAHTVASLEWCYNLTDFPLRSESDIIRYMKQGGFFGEYIKPDRARSVHVPTFI